MTLFSRREALAIAGAGLAEARPKPNRITGTFLQLSGALAEWDSAKWAEAFACFAELRLREYVVQWSAADDREFLESVRIIANLAAKSGSRLWIGLRHESAFWAETERSEAEIDRYLSGLSGRSLDLATRLRALPGIHGWYVPQEIEPALWSTGERAKILARFLRSPKPLGRTAVSTFSNGKMAPREFTAFWKQLIRESSLDTLFFQDGIGARKLTLDQAKSYWGDMTRARLRVRPIVEIFEQTSAEGANFSAVPATWNRIQEQLAIAGPKSIAFSVPEYMTPLGGQLAGQLYETARLSIGVDAR